MKKKILLPVIALALISTIGCKKEVSSDRITATDNEQSNAEAATSTYLPLTAGTYWVYNNQSGDKVKQSKLTVLNLKKTINFKAYTAVKTVQENNTDTSYYNQTLHNYYLFAGNDATGDKAVGIEILFLKDDVSVGTSWKIDAGTVQGNVLTCRGKILQKNISITVNGKTYNNVIHSYVEINKRVLLLNITLLKQDYYVAPNIGIIKTVSKQAINPSSKPITTSLTNYNIK
jgi:hypothetical protein